jgi:hypothetical protein
MKRTVILISVFFSIVNNLKAGTGHSKDMDLTYLVILAFFGIVLLIWNGFDYFRKNKLRISRNLKNGLLTFKERIGQYFKWNLAFK